jgi:hypothetical protein
VFQAAGASPGSVTVAVPADPALVGLSLFAQALSFQPVPPFVGSLSNRLDLVVE